MGTINITFDYAAEILLVFLIFLIVWHWNCNRNSAIINWPVIGMLPGLLYNARRIHEYSAQVLEQRGYTFVFKGPWLFKLDFVITSDPMNINHITSKNFANYPKGPEFSEIMEFLGDGVFNTDDDLWKKQRKIAHSIIKHIKFESASKASVLQKVEKGLIPILEHFSNLGIAFDLQNVIQRFTFDNFCQLVLGFDPNCLTVELPEVAYKKAFDEMEHVAFFRHMVPKSIWKLQKWLQIGEEKRLTRSWKVFDKFLYECISSKRSRTKTTLDDEDEYSLLAAFIAAEAEEVNEYAIQMGSRKPDEFLRDMAMNFIGAGRDTLSSCLIWFFWLVTTHPSVETKIIEEIETAKDDKSFSAQELHRLVYLQAALCETLRLYPPLPTNHKTAVEADILPSGHRVNKNVKILMSYYTVGRMEEIWGKDCLEFKPERWISEDGSILHVPSYKFTCFGAGPRTCLGKDMSFIQMKMIATVVIWNYHIQLVQDHPVAPATSLILHMKHGLMVRVSRRRASLMKIIVA